MSNSTILECSQKEANSTINNAHWTNSFNKDIVIEDGSLIQIKQCLINTQTVNSGNIVFLEDLLLTIVTKSVL